jgi:tryptophanyl-tRNA synthetase
MSLSDSTKKMSKSDPKETSKISLFDSADVIAEKIKRAKTDSIDGLTYDEALRPEVANLVNIFSAMTNRYDEGREGERERERERLIFFFCSFPANYYYSRFFLTFILNRRTREDICADFARADMLEFKLALTDVLIAGMRPITANLKRYEAERGYVERLLEKGAEKANSIAARNMKRINEILDAL